MSFVKGQHYLLKAKSGEVWVIYLENQTLLYKYFPPGRHYSPTPATLVDIPVLEYSAVTDSFDNIHIVCITKSGELKYFVGKPGSAMNSTVLADFDLKAQSLKHITLLLTAKRVHIFHLITNTLNSTIWAVIHSFWNGREWKDQQIGEIIAGKKVPPYTVDKDSKENIHIIFTSAHGGKFFEAQYKKFNKLYDLWSHTERITNLPENTPEVFSLIDRNDNLHLMTCGFSTVDNKVKICYCLRKEVTRNSSRWEPVITIHRPAQSAAWPLLCCRDNTIYGLWREQAGYMFSRSDDGGSSWSYPAPVNLAGKTTLLSYNSNYPSDVGRIKVPLFPGIAGSTVNLFLFDDYQVVPPFSPERPSLGGALSPPLMAGTQQEGNQTGSGGSTDASAEFKKSFAASEDLELVDWSDREDMKPETEVQIPAAVGATGGQDASIRQVEAAEVFQGKTDIENPTEEGIRGKLNSLEQNLVGVNETLGQLSKQQDQLIAVVSEKIEKSFQENETIAYLDTELQSVKDSQAGMEQMAKEMTKKNSLAMDALARLEETEAFLVGEISSLTTRVECLQETSDLLAMQQDEAGQLIGKLTTYQKRLEGEIDKILLTSGAIATVIEREVKERIESLGKEVADSRQRAEEIAGQFNEEVQVLTAGLNNQRNSIVNIGGRLEEYAGKQVDVLRQLEGAFEELAKIQREQEYLQQSRAELNSHREELAGLCKGQQDELVRLAQAQEDVKNNLVLVIHELRREFTAAQESINGKLEEQLQEIIDGIRKNSSHIASLEANEKTFQEKTARMEKEQEYVQEELQRLKNRGFWERVFLG